MVSKAQRKTKKATGKQKKQSARKVAKKTSKKTAKKVQKKSATKKGPKKRTVKKGAAAKKVTRKKAPSRKAPIKRTSQAAKKATTTLAVDELDDVTLLVDDTPKPAARSLKKKRGPKTPSVPRTVKPVPKVANTEFGPDLLEFIDAIDRYKQEYCRPFPTWREVFYLLVKLGYRKDKS